jgi:hypothetical protein
MKSLVRLLIGTVVISSLTACLFKEPVFSEGFVKIDPQFTGVWAMNDKEGDPRKTEFAVCLALDNDRYLLHYPTSAKGGIYYEGRLLKVRERNLMQLRVLATFEDGLPKEDAERFTLIWLEKDVKESMVVRSLGGGDRLKGKGPAEVKQLLEDKSADWNTLFGDSVVFRRLKDN